jgi:hypothetical protein
MNRLKCFFLGWINTGSMNDARYMHKASILPSGNVLVMGGIGNRAIALKSAELYDPSIGIWTTTGNMSCTRFGHTASVLANGKVLVAGGWLFIVLNCMTHQQVHGQLLVS